MLSIAHGTTGAYLASLCPAQPWLYIPAALIFHYLEDAVPHWDIGTGMKSGKRKKVTAALWEVLDLIATAALIFFLFQKTWPTTWSEINWPIWLGAFFGILPDFLEVPNSFFHTRPKLLAPIMKLHEKVHRSTPSPFWGLLPQALVVISVIFLTLFSSSPVL